MARVRELLRRSPASAGILSYRCSTRSHGPGVYDLLTKPSAFHSVNSTRSPSNLDLCGLLRIITRATKRKLHLVVLNIVDAGTTTAGEVDCEPGRVWRRIAIATFISIFLQLSEAYPNYRTNPGLRALIFPDNAIVARWRQFTAPGGIPACGPSAKSWRALNGPLIGVDWKWLADIPNGAPGPEADIFTMGVIHETS